MPTIEVAAEFGYVLMVSVGISVQCFLAGINVAKTRYSTMSQEYVDANMKDENEQLKKDLGTKMDLIKKGCHPDPGLGRLSSKLSLGDWYRLNAAQRCHGNYLESITSIQCALLFAGLSYPTIAAALGLAYMLGRYLYSTGFQDVTNGPGARVKGFATCLLCQLGLWGCCFVSGLQMSGLLDTIREAVGL